MGNKHFTHIIMDEAGQMMEPEALVPVCMASPTTSIILVGDDKQLGPVLQSPSGKMHNIHLLKIAQHHHMDESVMERLIRTCKVVYNVSFQLEYTLFIVNRTKQIRAQFHNLQSTIEVIQSCYNSHQTCFMVEN